MAGWDTILQVLLAKTCFHQVYTMLSKSFFKQLQKRKKKTIKPIVVLFNEEVMTKTLF